MALWSAWQADILPHVAQCPIPLIEHELMRAAQQFFAESRVWQVERSPISVTSGVSDLTIAPTDAQQELVRIETARWNGSQLRVKTASDMDASYMDDWRTHVGTPEVLIQVTPGLVWLYPIPDADGSLALRMSVRPSESATGIPDDMAVKFRDTLSYGAKSRLMLYPNKPWSAPDLGLALSVAFRSGIDAAAATASRSFGRGRIASRPLWC